MLLPAHVKPIYDRKKKHKLQFGMEFSKLVVKGTEVFIQFRFEAIDGSVIYSRLWQFIPCLNNTVSEIVFPDIQ